MSKRIPSSGVIYLAPGLRGMLENGIPIVIDEHNHNQKLDPRNVDDKIRIYEREVKGWFLEPATRLLNDSNSFENSFIVLMVCMSYLEGVEQYRQGRSSHSNSKKYFIASLERIYPSLVGNRDLGLLYRDARCGLFHNGMVRHSVIFNHEFDEAIQFENNGNIVKINPSKLLEDIKKDFEVYVLELKATNSDNGNANNTLRENFDRMFKVLD